MHASRSETLDVRGLRYHIRCWGDQAAPRIFLLHGWLDNSATFDVLAQALLPRFQVLAPDWRGFGLTEWAREGYWFPDYLADLEVILDHYSPGQAVALAGHSMGAQVASQYAGLRPDRVARLACLDGPYVPDVADEQIVQRQRQWLDQVRSPLPAQRYDSFETFAVRIRKLYPRVDAPTALAVAHAWARPAAAGGVEMKSDPKHRWVFPMLYRSVESMAIWSQITAPVLFVDGSESLVRRWLAAEELAERRRHFRHAETCSVPAGHMLHLEAPQQTAEQLLRFFAP